MNAQVYKHRRTDCEEFQLCSEGQNRGGDMTQLEPSIRSGPTTVLSQCKSKMLPAEKEREKGCVSVCVAVLITLWIIYSHSPIVGTHLQGKLLEGSDFWLK